MTNPKDDTAKILRLDLTDPINEDWIRSARLLKKAEAGDEDAQREWARLEKEAEEWLREKNAKAESANMSHEEPENSEKP